MPRSFCFPPVKYSRDTRPGHAASFLKVSAVADRGRKCGGSQRSDSRGRHEPSCDILATGGRLDLGCDVTNALFHLAQIGKQVCEQLMHCRREIVGLIFDSVRRVDLE